MKTPTIAVLGMAAILTGCTTSSKVQEMIDASNQNYLDRMQSHENSIDVLKKSAMAGLEKSKDNAAQLALLQQKLDAVQMQMKVVQGYADAAKVMSAANTVKVADLDEFIKNYKEETDKIIARMTAIDKLYEEVLIKQYQMQSDAATAAIDALKADGFSATTNAPVKLDKPMEIVAPDTSPTAPTSNVAPAK